VNLHLKDLESGALRPEVHCAPLVRWDIDAESTFQKLHADIEADANIGKMNIVFADE